MLVVACGCGDVVPHHLPDGPPAPDAAADSAGNVDAPPPRCDPAKPFGAATALTELNTTSDDVTASLTANELQIVFASARAGGVGLTDIYIATRTSTSQPFGAPSLLAGVNTSGRDSRPILTADGLFLYAEYLATPSSSWDIVRATRASTAATFSAASAVATIDSAQNDTAPFVMPDHSAIYFVSNRSGNNELYVATGANGNFGAPSLVTGTNLSGASTEDYPALTPDQKTMYFASDRAGGAGGSDIWVATRQSVVTGFDSPVNLGALNTGGADSPAWVSPDGCVLYFNRNVGVAASNYDLYVATKPL